MSDLAELKKFLNTPQGLNYFIQCLDPYHDFNYQFTGIPDARAVSSLVQMFKDRAYITIPPSFDKNASYNMHIYSTCFLNRVTTEGVVFDSADGVGMGRMRLTGKKLANSYITIRLSQGDLEEFITFDLKLDVDGDSYRTAGLGFEVHNTTAELYKSGSVTVYRTNPYEDDLNVAVHSGNYTYPNAHVRIGSTLPSNVSQANNLPGSVTWEAKEGCYVVVPPLVDNPFSAFGSRALVQIRGGTDDAVVTGQIPEPEIIDGKQLVKIMSDPPIVAEMQSTYIDRWKSTISNNVYTTGAFFTGLDPHSTFTVDTRLILETQPGYNASSLSRAVPCPVPDYRALEIIRAAIKILPPGTPVKNNSLGKWWGAVKHVTRQVLPLLMKLPGPVGVISGQIKKGDEFISEAARAITKAMDMKKANSGRV